MTLHVLSFRSGIALGVGLLVVLDALAQDTESMARRLVELRSEVETLNEELDVLREEHRAEMTSLAAQKAEIDAGINRQTTRQKQLETQRAEARAAAAQAGVDNHALAPVLKSAIEVLGEAIRGSMPFKLDERLADLDEIRTQLESGVVPANRAANRLWAFYEDEIRLTRENGIHSQTIELDGQRQLADVAKLGQVMMFFRTADETFGRAVQLDTGWGFERITDADQQVAVRNLFDSLAKQIRQGYFELPNALPGIGGQS